MIRRDPETQVVVTRAKAALGTWRTMDLQSLTRLELHDIANGRDAARVMVAPKAERRYQGLLEDLRSLQAAGIAEVD